jgi:hypothetical protein
MKRGKAFLFGSFGTLAVFAGFFVRHRPEVGDHLRSLDAVGLVLDLVALLVLLGLGGAWTLASSPKSMLQALTLGLGVPAMVFAADIPIGTQEGGSAGTPGSTASAPSTGGSRPDRWTPRLIFSPVSTVARVQREKAEAALATASTDLERIGRSAADLHANLRTSAASPATIGLADTVRLDAERARRSIAGRPR